MNRRPRWCHRVIVVVMYYHCMSVCRSIDVLFIFHHRRCGSSHVPLTFVILRRFFIANASFSFFFFLYNRRTRPASWDFLFSIVTRGHSSRSSFIFYHYFFIIISIIDITIRFIIIDYIIIEFVLYHSARMRTKRKKKERKKESYFEARVACNGNVSKLVFISCYITPSVLSVTSWFGKKENGKNRRKDVTLVPPLEIERWFYVR